MRRPVYITSNEAEPLVYLKRESSYIKCTNTELVAAEGPDDAWLELDSWVPLAACPNSPIVRFVLTLFFHPAIRDCLTRSP